MFLRNVEMMMVTYEMLYLVLPNQVIIVNLQHSTAGHLYLQMLAILIDS